MADGGFDLEIVPVEYSSLLEVQEQGDFDLLQLGWSGRVDPHGNMFNFLSTGAGNNYSGYSNPDVDDLLTEAATVIDPRARRAVRPGGHPGAGGQPDHLPVPDRNLTGYTDEVAGISTYADGVVRLSHAAFVAARAETDGALPPRPPRAVGGHAPAGVPRGLPGRPHAARRPRARYGGRGGHPERLARSAPTSAWTSRSGCSTAGSSAVASVTSASPPHRRPVTSMIAATLPVTLWLSLYAIVVAVVFGDRCSAGRRALPGALARVGGERVLADQPVRAELLARHARDPVPVRSGWAFPGVGLRAAH